MALEAPAADLDQLVEQYLSSGESAKRLAVARGWSIRQVTEYLRERGVLRTKADISRLRGKGARPDLAPFLDEYGRGATTSELAQRAGVVRSTMIHWLKDAGADIDRSHAAVRRNARLTAEQRIRMAAATSACHRGVPKSEAALARRALTRQQRMVQVDPQERALVEMLRARGIDGIVQQKAIGRYNCDIAAAPVAVEVFGGNWHAYGQHGARLLRRTRDILDAGWSVLLIWANSVHHPMTEAAADEAAAWIELARSNPSFGRQYRVIWGTGQFIAAGRPEDDELTLEPARTRSDYRRA